MAVARAEKERKTKQSQTEESSGWQWRKAARTGPSLLTYPQILFVFLFFKKNLVGTIPYRLCFFS